MKWIANIRRQIKKSGAYFIDQAMVSGGSFALTILLGRVLGPEAFGAFSLGWMGVLFVSSLQQAFVINPMLSLYAQQPEGYLTRLARLQLIVAFLSLVLGAILASALTVSGNTPVFGELILPVAFASIGHQLYDFRRKSLMVLQRVSQLQLLDGLVVGLQITLTIGMIYGGLLSPVNALFLLAISYLIPSLIPVCLQALKSGAQDTRGVLAVHWNYGRWLGATALLQWFSGNFFILAGGAILGTTAMGAIRMAQTITGALNVFLLTLENIVPVHAAQLMRAEGITSMRKYLQTVGMKTGLLFFPLLAMLAIAAPTIIEIAFGASYVQYAFVLRGFAVLYCLVFVGTLLRFYFRTTGATQQIFFAYIISTGACLLLAQPIVQAWGLVGITAGLVISQILICTWLIIRIRYSQTRIPS